MQKRVENFTRRKMFSSLGIIAMASIFTILQLIISWIYPAWFSWFPIGNGGLSKIALSIIATITSLMALVFLMFAVIKVVKLAKRKVYLNVLWYRIVLVVIVFVIYFLIPSAMPMNYFIPIITLFWFVTSMF